jgi:hypothetical protein
MRNAVLTLAALLLGAAACPAQTASWADKMFKDGTSHDFGSVPRGAQLFHRFTITNIYAVRMEITGVKSGCGCVSATAAKRVLEPRESTTIDVSMDARRFTGAKTVGIRVTVGPEYTSSAEIKVTANSRADIVFNPGQVTFGAVTLGQTPSQTIDVEYAGVLNWQVSEVIAKDAPVDVTIKELYRRPGQVGYQLQVTLRPDAPVGNLKHDLFLKTNDPASPLVPVLVEATVQSAVTVSPGRLTLGVVKKGEPLVRRVVVRSAKPFQVLDVDGGGGEITVEKSASAAPVQTVTLKCKFDNPGAFKRELKIKTDLQDVPVPVVIEGTVAP